MTQDAGRNVLGLRLIGGFKFACGLLLIALGVALFRNAGIDPGGDAEHLVAALRLDPDSHYIHALLAKISNISPGQFKALGIGTFLYALLYLVEGGGLLLRKRWAEYFTVVATGVFIPLEIYEVTRRATPIRIGLLVLNVAIVAYLIYQLRRKDRKGSSPANDPTPTSQAGTLT